MARRIGIAGAGIGGLAAAALLHDQGHEVVIHDQFERPGPVGSGLVIQPVGQTVLDRIGAGDAARAFGARIERMLGHEAATGKPVLDVSYARKGSESFGLAIHRASLFDVLHKAVLARDIRLETGFRVAGQDGGKFRTDDGRESEQFDLLIDASGANSALSPLVSRPLPYGAVWGVVDWPDCDLPQTWLSQQYRKAQNMIGALPIGTLPGDPTPKAAIFWSLPAESEAAFRARGLEDWKSQATRLWPEFAPFAAQVSNLDQLTMARYSHGTMVRPYLPGLAFIGDAAHRASPQLGQGANMALLDAFALSRAIEQASDNPLPLYAAARRWHVRMYQSFSWAFTPQYQSDSTILPWVRDTILFPVSTIWPMPKVLNRLVCGDLIAPVGRGLG